VGITVDPSPRHSLPAASRLSLGCGNGIYVNPSSSHPWYNARPRGNHARPEWSSPAIAKEETRAGGNAATKRAFAAWEVSEIGAESLGNPSAKKRRPMSALGGNRIPAAHARVGRNGRQPDVTSEGKRATEKAPSGSEPITTSTVAVKKSSRCASYIGRLVDAVVAKLGEHVAVHCKRARESLIAWSSAGLACAAWREG